MSERDAPVGVILLDNQENTFDLGGKRKEKKNKRKTYSVESKRLRGLVNERMNDHERENISLLGHQFKCRLA